jgi:CheY-like chemotaxis protein
MTSPIPIPGARPVLCVMSDLMFRSRIDDVTTRLGLPLRAAKSMEQLERHLANGAPAIAIVDLECDSLDPTAAIQRLRATPDGAALAIVGYAGHTNATAIAAGRAAGAGVVLARSAFTAQLAPLLEKAATAERARTASANPSSAPGA